MMKKLQCFFVAIVFLIPVPSSLAAGTKIPDAKELIASAPRISLDEENISSFEVRGMIKGGGVSLRFIASGQKPKQYSVALIDPQDNTPIAVATQDRLTFYNPLTGQVTVMKKMAPIFELEIVEEKQPEIGNKINLNIGFAAPGGKDPIRVIIDVRSLLKVGMFKVHPAGKNRFVLQGKTKTGSRTTAYFRQGHEYGTCERIELTPHGAEDNKPALILDSILINPRLPAQRFVFPDSAIKASGMPITEVVNGPETPAENIRTLAGALLARAVMYDMVKNSELKLTEAEWNRLKKSDKTIASTLRNVFADQLSLPQH